MSRRTFVSFYIKKNQRDNDRISSFLSGSSSTKAKKRTSVSTSATAEASTSRVSTAEASTSRSSFERGRGETEVEAVLIGSTGSDNERQTSPLAQARKRRRTEKGREQHSDGNFSKFFKTFNKNIF